MILMGLSELLLNLFFSNCFKIPRLVNVHVVPYELFSPGDDFWQHLETNLMIMWEGEAPCSVWWAAGRDPALQYLYTAQGNPEIQKPDFFLDSD